MRAPWFLIEQNVLTGFFLHADVQWLSLYHAVNRGVSGLRTRSFVLLQKYRQHLLLQCLLLRSVFLLTTQRLLLLSAFYYTTSFTIKYLLLHNVFYYTTPPNNIFYSCCVTLNTLSFTSVIVSGRFEGNEHPVTPSFKNISARAVYVYLSFLYLMKPRLTLTF